MKFSKLSIKPEKLGLPKLIVKTDQKTKLYPRFSLIDNKLVIEFGHYFGFGAYFASTINKNNTGLRFYSDDMQISKEEILKVKTYLKAYKHIIKKGLK